MSFQPPNRGWTNQPPQGYPPNYSQPPLPIPPRRPGFDGWFHRQSRNAKIGIISAVVILFLIVGVIGSLNSNQEQAVQQQQVQPTEAPIPKPLPIKERIAAIARDNGSNVSVYLEAQKSAGATFDLGQQWDIASARDSIEIKCFDVQKAFWTASPTLGLESATVTLNGPLVDAYGKESTSQVGICTLKRATAARFNWDNLNWESAWRVYDNTGMLPSLVGA